MSSLSLEERQAIRDSFARLLADRSTEADVRRVMETEGGYDPALWSHVAQLGLAGVLVPDKHGGVGASAVEVEALMEEAGAALLCAPLLCSAVVAAALLMESSDADAQERLLPGIASGERLATVAFTGEGGLWTPGDVTVTARRDGEVWRLAGRTSFVSYGAQADTLLVVARAADDLAVFEVDPACDGVIRTPLKTFDRTQRMARIDFHAALARPIAGADGAAIERCLDMARLALAAEQAGAARRVFDFTLEYLRTRVQFGRPIGGFQALKHMAADLLVEVESATSAAREAAVALAEQRGDAKVLVNLAAFACADAFSQVAASAVQMHGGIAFTWEHPAHLYLRRARADAQMFGSADAARDRYLSALEAAHD
jgi:alkylation response protein AidB-like acyl-CoA dehydrogenase